MDENLQSINKKYKELSSKHQNILNDYSINNNKIIEIENKQTRIEIKLMEIKQQNNIELLKDMSTIKTNKIKNVEENVNIENKDIKKLEEKIIFFEKNINDKMSADINLMHLSICNKLIIIEKQINDVVNKQIEQKERHNSFIYKCKEGFEETAKQQKELNVAMYNQTDKLRTLESKNIKQINNEEKVIEKATIIMSNKINTQLTEIKQILQKKT